MTPMIYINKKRVPLQPEAKAAYSEPTELRPINHQPEPLLLLMASLLKMTIFTPRMAIIPITTPILQITPAPFTSKAPVDMAYLAANAPRITLKPVRNSCRTAINLQVDALWEEAATNSTH